MVDTQILKKVSLFQSLSLEELELLAKLVHEKDVIAGDYVFDEGAEATSMFVLKMGSVEILKKGGKGDEQKVAELSAGSHFGEMALLDRAPRAAAAMAREPVKLLELKYEDLEKLMSSKPEFGIKLYRALAQTLCRRIRHTTGDLSSLKELKLKNL